MDRRPEEQLVVLEVLPGWAWTRRVVLTSYRRESVVDRELWQVRLQALKSVAGWRHHRDMVSRKHGLEMLGNVSSKGLGGLFGG